mgnify:CR=1 FL=1
MSDKILMVPMSREYAEEVCSWEYSGECKVYNMPSWNEMVEKNYSLTIPEKRESEYKAFISESNELLAMCRYVKKNNGIMVGVGVNPDYLSMGIGKTVIKAFTEWLLRTFPGSTIYMEVRTWNNRAIECYKKCGYEIAEEFVWRTPIGEGTFYRLYYTE